MTHFLENNSYLSLWLLLSLAPVCCILSHCISWSFPGVLQDKDLFSVFADPSMLDT